MNEVGFGQAVKFLAPNETVLTAIVSDDSGLRQSILIDVNLEGSIWIGSIKFVTGNLVGMTICEPHM